MKIGYSPPVPTDWLIEISKEFNISYSKTLSLYQTMDKDKEKLLSYLQSNSKEENLPKLTVFQNGILAKNKFYDFARESNRNLLNMLENNEFDRDIFEDLFGIGNAEQDVLIEKRDEFYSQEIDLSELKRNISDAYDDSKRIKRNCNEISESINNNGSKLIYKFIIGKGKVLDTRNDSIRNQEGSTIVDKGSTDFNSTSGNSSYNCDNDNSNSLNNGNLKAMATNIEECQNLILPATFSLGFAPSIKFKLVFKNKESKVLADQNLRISDVLLYIQNVLQRKCSILLADEILDENESIMALKYCVADVI